MCFSFSILLNCSSVANQTRFTPRGFPKKHGLRFNQGCDHQIYESVIDLRDKRLGTPERSGEGKDRVKRGKGAIQQGDGLIWFIISGQIIATSHDLTPNGGLVREIPLFQGNLGWWNIIIWPDNMSWLFLLMKYSRVIWNDWGYLESRTIAGRNEQR